VCWILVADNKIKKTTNNQGELEPNKYRMPEERREPKQGSS
jgi:hypothetical protein